MRESNNGRRGFLVFIFSFQVCSCFINIVQLLAQDHMRKAGDVCFSEVYRDRDGKQITVFYSKNFLLEVARALC